MYHIKNTGKRKKKSKKKIKFNNKYDPLPGVMRENPLITVNIYNALKLNFLSNKSIVFRCDKQ